MTVGLPEAGVATVDEHAFEPRGAWYSLCRICGLALAAHTRSSVELDVANTYRCPDCVQRGASSCSHGRIV